jgi:hypothetical protein
MILTKIYINNEQIDLKEDVSIPLNFNIADIREPEKRSTTWSKTVVLPGSTFNNELFSNIWNVNAVINSTGTTNFTPNFNPNLKAIAEITYNEATQFKGICQLLNVNVTDKYEIEYEVAFFGELQNVYQDFTNGYLRDLDLTEYNHDLNVTNQVASWSAPIGEGYVYSMIDYGNRINSEFKVNEMYPAVYVKTIIDKMFSQSGFTYQSVFFNSELFKRLIIPYSGGSTLQLTSNDIEDRTFRVSNTSIQSINIDTFYSNEFSLYNIQYNKFILFQDETTPPNFDNTNVFINNNKFVANANGLYNFKFDFTLNVTHNCSTATAYIPRNYELGTIYIVKKADLTIPLTGDVQPWGYGIASIPVILKPSDIFPNTTDALNVSAGASQTVTQGATTVTVGGLLSGNIDVLENEEVAVIFAPGFGRCYKATSSSIIYQNQTTSYPTVNFQINSSFYNQLANTDVQENDTIDISKILPDKIKQSEFFNSIVKMFNLFVEVDKTNANKLIIEPRPTFYNTSTTKDWSDKLDYSKETKIIPMGELNNKTYLFTYKQDNDYFNSNYFNNYTEVYGQKKYDIQNDFLKGEVKTELIFSPTPSVNTIGHDRVIPKIYQLDTNGTIKTCQSNIRILYYGGLKDTSYPWSHIATSGTTIREDYAYCGHLDSIDNPTIDLNFEVPKQVYYSLEKYTLNNLYNKYWKDYIEQIADKDSKLFVGYFLVNEWDIQELDFRNTFFFENEYWRLNKIIDYDRVNNQPTKCEFIKLKTLPPYEDDNGFDTNGGVLEGVDISPTQRNSYYNDNVVTEGAIVSGKNNTALSGNGVIIVGNANFVGNNNQNVSILSSVGVTVYPSSNNISVTTSTGVTVLSGVSNISVTNSSGITVTESNVTYNNGIKTLNNVSYKKYVALLSQSGVTAPTVVELETTMSSGITTSYDSTGLYKLISNGEFTVGKTIVLSTPTRSDAFIAVIQSSASELYINTKDITSDTPFIPNANDLLDNTAIEIRVYS